VDATPKIYVLSELHVTGSADASPTSVRVSKFHVGPMYNYAVLRTQSSPYGESEVDSESHLSPINLHDLDPLSPLRITELSRLPAKAPTNHRPKATSESKTLHRLACWHSVAA
jgi:hypothetical protein